MQVARIVRWSATDSLLKKCNFKL